ncbi:ROK family protein [Streptomyces sp. TS71-3]|uniref:ROK family protein n=1 Tax=Streptomyces sp. TS71-3 TaxID=2733862 RepID=UPI001B1BB6D3|nr:ROK family protein [Streptomyces sp. TS71-3]GHJ39415.1 glucokinase [Streptomyces sp. TS71-3]
MIPVLEIGGTHVTAALVDPRDGHVTARTRGPLDAHGGAEDILGTVRRCADGLPAPAGARWGVAVPGPFDYARGIALFAGVGKFEALYGVDVRTALLDGLRKRPGDVAFVNDAHAFLLGEWSTGAGRGHRRVVGITLGTGVGSAFLADGRIRESGPGVPPEGRLDLTELDGRPLEDSVSRRAILARYGDRDADVRDVAERARAGEGRARRVLDDAFTGLGTVLGPRLADFGASALVVGGSIAGSWDLVAPALRSGLAAGSGRGRWVPDDADPGAGPPPPGAPQSPEGAASPGPDRGARAAAGHTRVMKPADRPEDAALIGAACAASAEDRPRG